VKNAIRSRAGFGNRQFDRLSGIRFPTLSA
jgi:hypothetical protein